MTYLFTVGRALKSLNPFSVPYSLSHLPLFYLSEGLLFTVASFSPKEQAVSLQLADYQRPVSVSALHSEEKRPSRVERQLICSGLTPGAVNTASVAGTC